MLQISTFPHSSQGTVNVGEQERSCAWCLVIWVQYALLMRANKPETAVQSSALFLLAPHGLSIMGCVFVQHDRIFQHQQSHIGKMFRVALMGGSSFFLLSLSCQFFHQVSGLSALASCHYLVDQRERVFQVLYKAINSSVKELQEAGKASMKKVSHLKCSNVS